MRFVRKSNRTTLMPVVYNHAPLVSHIFSCINGGHTWPSWSFDLIARMTKIHIFFTVNIYGNYTFQTLHFIPSGFNTVLFSWHNCYIQPVWWMIASPLHSMLVHYFCELAQDWPNFWWFDYNLASACYINDANWLCWKRCVVTWQYIMTIIDKSLCVI